MAIAGRCTRIGRYSAALVMLLAVAGAASAADPWVRNLRTQTVDEWLYFAVDIAPPEEVVARTPATDSAPATEGRSPYPELFTIPWRDCTIFLDSWGDAPLSRVRRFVGRCKPRETLVVHYRHEVQGSWERQPITLDFQKAETYAETQSLAARWAEQGSYYFSDLNGRHGDPSGFYEYARQQMRSGLGGLARTQRVFARSADSFGRDEYELATGWLAIQESLQLDRLLTTERRAAPRHYELSSIKAVQTKSHPYDAMRAGREPKLEELSAVVPADFWYAHFSELSKLLELAQLTEDWGGAVLRAIAPSRAEYRLFERTLAQLALDRATLEQLAQSDCVRAVALIGSDPYFHDGTDVTVLFRVTDEQRFLDLVDQPLAQWQAETGLTVAQRDLDGWVVQRLVDRQRRVSLHRTRVGEGIWALSNSHAALERLRAVAAGKAPALRSAPDFQYIRATIFEGGHADEDGLIYLSDAFIRHVVGPALRIGAARRAEAVTSMRILSNAWLLHGYLHGPVERTYEQMIEAKTLTESDLFDPEGGSFHVDGFTGAARSERWGSPRFLTPLIEMPVQQVTRAELDQYEQFRRRYEQYWRRYFDPIAIRVRLGRSPRIETCILPLINNSTYDDLVRECGGPPITIRSDQITPQTILRFTSKLGDGELRKMLELNWLADLAPANPFKWPGNWVAFWLEDSPHLTTVARKRTLQQLDEISWVDPFRLGIVLAAQVQNPLILAAGLVKVRQQIETTSPNTVVFRPLPHYHDYGIVQIAPDPRGWLAAWPPTSQPASRPLANPEDEPFAVYYATIGDAIHVSTMAGPLRSRIDQVSAPPATQPGAGREYVGNWIFHLLPSVDGKLRETIGVLLEHESRGATLTALPQIELLGRCGALEHQSFADAAMNVFGYAIVNSAEDEMTFDPQEQLARSERYGTRYDPQMPDLLAENSPLRSLLTPVQMLSATLRLTPEGVITTVQIERR